MSDSIAIFIDAENQTSWIKRGGLKRLESELSPYGQVIVRKAYGNWSKGNLANIQSSLNEYGFDFIHTYHPVSKKNSADIRMTVDAMDAAHNPKIKTVVLATGDSDFSPLFRRLRELVENVIGIGPKSPLSESVKTSCTQFIYTDTAVPTHPGKTTQENASLKRTPPSSSPRSN